MNESSSSHMTKNTKITRRTLLQGAAGATAAFSIIPGHVLGAPGQASSNEKLNIAGIGIGGMGGHNLSMCAAENIVALCDVDSSYAGKTFATYPRAKRYTDFRVMLDEQKDIDAVIVATPDHSHAMIALAAMERGKHVYVQKPLAHSVAEARAMTEAARKHKVMTQMGNQGHSGDGVRDLCEWIWDGAIGDGPRGPRLDQPPRLAPGDRGGAAQGDTARPVQPRLGQVDRPRAVPPLQSRLSSGELAGLVGLRHRFARRSRLPHPRCALLGLEAEVPGQRGRVHLDLLA